MSSTYELPDCLEAEQELLGLLLAGRPVLPRIHFLKPEHFGEEWHGEIFKACLAIGNEGGEVNFPTVRMRLACSQESTKYLAKLAATAIHGMEAIDLANVIHDTATKRALIASCEATILRACEAGQSAEEVTAHALAELDAIASPVAASKIKDDAEITLDILREINTRRPIVSTGLSKLDDAMGGGLYAGKSYGFAARKKVGKTVLASTISYNLNAAGVPHLFICGEMGPQEIHERNLCRELNVYPSIFNSPEAKETCFQDRLKHSAAKSNRCIKYQNAPGLTLADLRQFIAAAIAKHKIQGVILDYWQLVEGQEKGQSEATHLGKVAQWLANYGRKYGVWNITMAQINQEGNTRGGEGLRLAYDQVFQIHREDISAPKAWVEMMDTRYTKWTNIGSEECPGLLMNAKGPYFEIA